MNITADEISQFIRDGYMTRQLDIAELTRQSLINLSWAHISEMNPHFDRDDAITWRGDVVDSCRTAAIAKRRGRVKLRECVQDEPLIREVVFEDPQILAVVKGLIGENAVPRRKPRGLYPLFPSKTSSHKLPGGMDAHPFQVSCIVYLTDVLSEDNGPFNVWKGSHKVMHDAFDGRASWQIDRPKSVAMALEVEATHERQPILGPKGTAVFWHHRALHTPGTNRTDKIRHVIIGDFHASDWASKKDEPHHPDVWIDWAINAEDAFTETEKVRMLG